MVEVKRKRAVFVSAHIPDPNALQAGHKTAFQFLTELSQTYEVDVVIACRKSEAVRARSELPKIREVAASVSVVELSVLDILLGIGRGAFLKLPPRLSTRVSHRLISSVRDLVLSDRCEMLWCEFSQSFWVSRVAVGRVPVRLSAHDLQTQVVARKGAWECLPFLGWTFRAEKKLLDGAEKIRVQSKKDADLLETFFQIGGIRVEVSRPKLSEFVFSVRRNMTQIAPYTILFWGAMNRRENSAAAIAFATGQFERLRERFPKAELWIVGANPPDQLVALCSEHIRVTGFVADPTEFFEKCSVGIAPLESGAGVKVKVLEMLAAGIPVISTPVGGEGIEEQPRLKIARGNEFAEEIAGLWRLDGCGREAGEW